ncbi:MAG TPA: hypothetical protein VF796_12445 [Humisphaera sp.]
MIRTFVFAVMFAGLVTAPVARAADAPPARATPEQLKFVTDQLDRLKAKDLFTEQADENPKKVIDALVGRGKEILPALKQAMPDYTGRAREACARAILLLTWGFDPEEKVNEAIKKEAGGKPLPATAKRTALSDPAVARLFPDAHAWTLTMGVDPQSGHPVAGVGSLKSGNLVLLAREGGVTVVSTTKAVELMFRNRLKPADPAKPGPAIAEPQAREILSAWVTLGSVVSADALATYRPAPDTFTVKQNGPRWVLTGRAFPQGPAAEKAGQRQWLVILGPDGQVLTATESAGLRPVRK